MGMEEMKGGTWENRDGLSEHASSSLFLALPQKPSLGFASMPWACLVPPQGPIT